MRNDYEGYELGGPLQPANLELEQFILGACFKRPENIKTAATQMNHLDFYDPQNQFIFKAIVDLRGDGIPIDLGTVRERVQQNGGEVEKGYLEGVIRDTPSIANIDTHIGIVREKSIYRNTLAALNNTADNIYANDGRSATEILAAGIKELQQLNSTAISGADNVRNLSQILDERLKNYQQRAAHGGPVDSYKTGIAAYDDNLMGIANTEFLVIGGRPAMGKTSLAISMLSNIATKYKVPCPIFSLEMPGSQLVDRMICSTAGVNAKKFKEGSLNHEELKRVNQAAAIIDQMNLLIDEDMRLTPNIIRNKMMRFQDKHGDLGPAMVDYIQLVRPDGPTRTEVEVVQQVTREFKIMAGEFNCPFIGVSQLNRDIEYRIRNNLMAKPEMADNKNGGSIEQDANTVVMCHRPTVYSTVHAPLGDPLLNDYAELVIAKAREGEPGVHPMQFIGENTLYLSGDPATLSEQQALFHQIADEKAREPKFTPSN